MTGRQGNEALGDGTLAFTAQLRKAMAQLDMDLAVAAGDEERARQLMLGHYRGIQEACERIIYNPGLLVTGANGGRGADKQLRRYALKVRQRAGQAIAELGEAAT